MKKIIFTSVTIILASYSICFSTTITRPLAVGHNFNCDCTSILPLECDKCRDVWDGLGFGDAKWTFNATGTGYSYSIIYCKGANPTIGWTPGNVYPAATEGSYTIRMSSHGAVCSGGSCQEDNVEYYCSWDVYYFNGWTEVHQDGNYTADSPIRKLKLFHGPMTTSLKAATYNIQKSNSSTATTNASFSSSLKAAIENCTVSLGFSSSTTTSWGSTFSQPFSAVPLNHYLGQFYNQPVWSYPIKYRSWSSYSGSPTTDTYTTGTAYRTFIATVWSQEAADQTALGALESNNLNVSLNDSTSLTTIP